MHGFGVEATVGGKNDNSRNSRRKCKELHGRDFTAPTPRCILIYFNEKRQKKVVLDKCYSCRILWCFCYACLTLFRTCCLFVFIWRSLIYLYIFSFLYSSYIYFPSCFPSIPAIVYEVLDSLEYLCFPATSVISCAACWWLLPQHARPSSASRHHHHNQCSESRALFLRISVPSLGQTIIKYCCRAALTPRPAPPPPRRVKVRPWLSRGISSPFASHWLENHKSLHWGS